VELDITHFNVVWETPPVFGTIFFQLTEPNLRDPCTEKECFTFCDIVQNLMRNFLIISWYPVTLDLLQFTESLLALKLGVVVNRILMSIIHLFWPNEQIWAIKREQVTLQSYEVTFSRKTFFSASSYLNYFARNFLKDNCCPGFLSQGLFLDLHVWYKIKIKVLTKYQKLPLCMVMLRLFVSVERCEWCPLQTAFFRICVFD
jgi:hypothetical protein